MMGCLSTPKDNGQSTKNWALLLALLGVLAHGLLASWHHHAADYGGVRSAQGAVVEFSQPDIDNDDDAADCAICQILSGIGTALLAASVGALFGAIAGSFQVRAFDQPAAFRRWFLGLPRAPPASF